MQLVRPRFESTLAIADRLASTPEPLQCLRLHHLLCVCRGRECGNQQPSHVISSSAHVVHAAHANGAYQQAAAAPRLWLEQQRISTEAIDADTTIFVSIGARSGSIRCCGWFSRISSRPWQ